MVRKIALDVAFCQSIIKNDDDDDGAYNGAGSVIHWMTPPPLASHLKTFWGPKFELPALKILTTWNVHMVQIVQF